jgi:hypothetical protein
MTFPPARTIQFLFVHWILRPCDIPSLIRNPPVIEGGRIFTGELPSPLFFYLDCAISVRMFSLGKSAAMSTAKGALLGMSTAKVAM